MHVDGYSRRCHKGEQSHSFSYRRAKAEISWKFTFSSATIYVACLLPFSPFKSIAIRKDKQQQQTLPIRLSHGHAMGSAGVAGPVQCRGLLLTPWRHVSRCDCSSGWTGHAVHQAVSDRCCGSPGRSRVVGSSSF